MLNNDENSQIKKSQPKTICNLKAHVMGCLKEETDRTHTLCRITPALNKWLKPRVAEGCVVHSFRHSLRDRLKAMQCPSDMIDQIGGWSTAGVEQACGEGYRLQLLHGEINKMT